MKLFTWIIWFIFEILKTNSLLWVITHNIQLFTASSVLICFTIPIHNFDMTNIYCLYISYNRLVMTLLHHFCHQKCSIYCLVIICLGIIPDNQYQIFFNVLLDHSWIVINFVHSYIINICQAKSSQTRKTNLEKYIAPFTRLIIMNIPNCFVKFVIGMNTGEFCIRYGLLKKFCIYKSLCIPMKYPAILVSFPLKIPIF